jgi:hypothetical protein
MPGDRTDQRRVRQVGKGLDENGHRGSLVEPRRAQELRLADEPAEVIGPVNTSRRKASTQLFPFIHR